MAAFWPTSTAKENDPIVADRMNMMEKLVFSKTLQVVARINEPFHDSCVLGKPKIFTR
jgi:hypothetical protein